MSHPHFCHISKKTMRSHISSCLILLFSKAIAHKTRYAEALQIGLERRSLLLRKLLTAPAMWPKRPLTEAEREQHAQV